MSKRRISSNDLIEQDRRKYRRQTPEVSQDIGNINIGNNSDTKIGIIDSYNVNNYYDNNPNDAKFVILSRLPYATEARFDSHFHDQKAECLDKTREELLEEVYRWTYDPDSPCIFWLSGLAGTGKSTISKTVAKHFSNRGHLGASFFFSRDKDDLRKVGKFFTTIAHQLAFKFPALGDRIKEAFTASPDIGTSNLKEQWKTLIYQPLSGESAASSTSLHHLVFVFDALDECEDRGYLSLVLTLLTQVKQLSDSNISCRIFLTSRPDIQKSFLELSPNDYSNIVLHNVEQAVVDNDITLYFENEFAKIRRFHGLKNWPNKEKIEELVARAEPLHRIYLQVLRSAIIRDVCGDTSSSKLLEWRIQKVVGALVLLSDTMSLSALAHLIDLRGSDNSDDGNSSQDSDNPYRSDVTHYDTQEAHAQNKNEILSTLRRLRSIVDTPDDENSPMRLIHKSFPDFLLNKKTCTDTRFHIDKEKTHEELFEQCLIIMTTGLKKDVCRLQNPGMFMTDVSLDTVDLYLKEHTRYSCRFWVRHLVKSKAELQDGGKVHCFLRTHFLYWLEALALIHALPECIYMLSALQGMLTIEKSPELFDLLDDARRFIYTFRYIVERAPLQVYCCLLSCPEYSVIKSCYSRLIPKWVTIHPHLDKNWDSVLQRLIGHSAWVTSIAISPDHNLIASGSYDESVRLWNLTTGALVDTLQDHSNPISAVAFSLDGSLIASGFMDGTIQLWSTTGILQHTIKGDTDQIVALAFIFDRSHLQFKSFSGPIKRWNFFTDNLHCIFESISKSANVVTFSIDGTLSAMASHNTVTVCDSTDPSAINTPQYTLEDCGADVTAVAFSLDSTHLATGSSNGSIEVWNLITVTRTCKFSSSHYGVHALTFSPDKNYVAYVTMGFSGAIEIRNIMTGSTSTHVINKQSHFTQAIVFSSDGAYLISTSEDDTIKLWDWVNAIKTDVIEDHSTFLRDVAHGLSSDDKYFTTQHFDVTVKLWTVENGVLQSTLQDFSCLVGRFIFSLDGMHLANGNNEYIKIWDVATGTLQRTLNKDPMVISSDVEAIAFSSDSTCLASKHHNELIMIWNTATGALVNSSCLMSDKKTCSSSIVYSTNDAYLAFTNGLTIQVLNAHSLQRLWYFDLHLKDRSITELAFSCDNSCIVSNEGTFHLDHQDSLICHGSHNALSKLSLTDGWVIYNGRKILWFPPKDRGKITTYGKSVIVLQDDDSRPAFVNFDLKALDLVINDLVISQI